MLSTRKSSFSWFTPDPPDLPKLPDHWFVLQFVCAYPDLGQEFKPATVVWTSRTGHRALAPGPAQVTPPETKLFEPGEVLLVYH